MANAELETAGGSGGILYTHCDAQPHSPSVRADFPHEVLDGHHPSWGQAVETSMHNAKEKRMSQKVTES